MKLFGKKSSLISAIYPDVCIACNKVVKSGEYLCPDCFPFTRKISHPVCNSCGRSQQRCDGRCKKPSYDFVCAPFYYSGAIRDGLRKFKFNDRPRTAEFFIPEMAEFLKTEHPDFKADIITYVPMTKFQLESRGYNQSKILAEELSKVMNIEFSNDILLKKYDIEPQHNLKSAYRAGNVLGVFDVKDKALIEGKNVIVVDDIKTTGATLNECAKILKLNGAAYVGCVCAAIVI